MSKLPKTKYPIFEIAIPSSGKKINYRQMLVQDEKILLTAKASEDESDIFRAVKQVVNNCIIDDIDIDTLATFDIEYLFIKFRAVSIGNVIEVVFEDTGDESEYKFIVDLDEVEVKFPDDVKNIINTTEESGLSLKYPPSSLFDDNNALLTGKDGYEYLAAKCIDKIYDGDEVYDAAEADDSDLLDYIHQLDSKSYALVKEFINNVPRIQYSIEYQNAEGVQRKLELNTLTDFFTFW